MYPFFSIEIFFFPMEDDKEEASSSSHPERQEDDIKIRIPQLQVIDGEYVSSQGRHEETIKRHLTVIVSRNAARNYQIPFVCHSMSEFVPSNPLDKSSNVTPYTSLLDEEEVTTYYNRVAELEEIVSRDSLSPELQAHYDKLNRLDRELWHNHISEGELRQRVANERKRVVKEQARVACHVPIVDIQHMTSKQIRKHLSFHVRNHDRNIMEIAHGLSPISQPIQAGTNLFLKFVFAGSTGIGKTDLINHIAHLCHMQPGGEYRKCHIELNFATCLDKGHANIITGPGPGYAGCDEPCLVDHLLDAVDFLNEKEKEIAERGGERRVKIIMLEINEMDKGTLSIFTALNSFLNNGHIKSHRNRNFTLPPDVFLIMCACSNFASDYFRSLPPYAPKNYAEATDKIVAAMKEKGLPEWDIARLGRPIPFFPINKVEAKEIIRFKLRELISKQALYIHRIRMSMSMRDNTQDDFIDHIMDNLYDRNAGNIRQILERLQKEITFNLTTQREFLEENLEVSIPVPLRKRPELVFQRISYEKLAAISRSNLTMASFLSDAYLKERDRSHDLNESNLSECLAAKCDIAFFVLDCGDIIKKKNNKSIIGIHVLSPMPLQPYQEEMEEDKPVIEILKEPILKRKYSSNEKKKRKKKKKEVEEKQEEEEEEEENDIQTEYDWSLTENNNNNTMEEDISSSSERDRGKGRPPKEIDGFTFYEYDRNTRRSRYRCDNPDCRDIVETRRIKTHKCKRPK